MTGKGCSIETPPVLVVVDTVLAVVARGRTTEGAVDGKNELAVGWDTCAVVVLGSVG